VCQHCNTPQLSASHCNTLQLTETLCDTLVLIKADVYLHDDIYPNTKLEELKEGLPEDLGLLLRLVVEMYPYENIYSYI